MVWGLYLNKGVIKNTEAEAPGPILGPVPEYGFSCWERNGEGKSLDNGLMGSSDHLATAKLHTHQAEKLWCL